MAPKSVGEPAIFTQAIESVYHYKHEEEAENKC